MSKAKVNAILKEHGLANIKMKTDYSGFGTVTVKDWDGKMIKGISLGSHSPMDCTSIPTERVATNKRKVIEALSHLPKVGERIVVIENSKSITYLHLTVERYATYARSMNLDNGYLTSYLVPLYVKESK